MICGSIVSVIDKMSDLARMTKNYTGAEIEGNFYNSRIWKEVKYLLLCLFSVRVGS